MLTSKEKPVPVSQRAAHRATYRLSECHWKVITMAKEEGRKKHFFTKLKDVSGSRLASVRLGWWRWQWWSNDVVTTGEQFLFIFFLSVQNMGRGEKKKKHKKLCTQKASHSTTTTSTLYVRARLHVSLLGGELPSPPPPPSFSCLL